jgi:beta-catenin-like protein 1
VRSLLGLLAHDNTDVSLAVVGLLVELTDPDTGEEAPTEMGRFVDALLQYQGLELLVQNLSRLDETTSVTTTTTSGGGGSSKDGEDAEKGEGVYATLSVLENLLEFRPAEVASSLCARTGALKYLLKKLKQRKFDSNKLYCAEVLASLLACDPQVSQRILF